MASVSTRSTMETPLGSVSISRSASRPTTLRGTRSLLLETARAAHSGFNTPASTSHSLIGALPQILSALPKEWRGTTFKNSALLGRVKFAERLLSLVSEKGEKGEQICTSDLEGLGNAEDYLRVATNISVVLEAALAAKHGLDVSRVFTFASSAMPIVAVVLSLQDHEFDGPVKLYTGIGTEKLAAGVAADLNTLELLGGKVEVHVGSPPARGEDVGIVVALESAVASESWAAVDAVVGSNVLYLTSSAVRAADVHVIRKRMATPMTTPMAEAMLQRLAGVTVTANTELPTDDELRELSAHLQALSGTDVDAGSNPVFFTAGLPTIASLWMSLIADGGADICMASTAYGGSSQLSDVLSSRSSTLRKHTYDIQGNATVSESIARLLGSLAADVDSLMPTTVLFSEVPTNPDMKVPEMAEICRMLREYKELTGRKIVLLVDATFAPSSRVMHKVRELDSDLSVLVFLSLSKSVSRGITTAGALVANHTEHSRALLSAARRMGKILDTNAKPDQMLALCQNHRGVEERGHMAYQVAKGAGDHLRQAVMAARGEDMPLAFVSPANASDGFTTSTFSFNLPAQNDATPEANAALAQKFVDRLTAHAEFKPCVSFGQDNGMVYATVPATSTQGAIKAEDKAKQAVGGVQLVRLSFPPSIDTAHVYTILETEISALYR